MTEERLTWVFAAAWLTFSGAIGVLLWAKAGPMWALFWMWVFIGLATWALASRVPPRDKPAPVPPATTPDYSDPPLHIAE